MVFLMLCNVMHFTFDGNPKMMAILGVYSYTRFILDSQHKLFSVKGNFTRNMTCSVYWVSWAWLHLMNAVEKNVYLSVPNLLTRIKFIQLSLIRHNGNSLQLLQMNIFGLTYFFGMFSTHLQQNKQFLFTKKRVSQFDVHHQ